MLALSVPGATRLDTEDRGPSLRPPRSRPPSPPARRRRTRTGAGGRGKIARRSTLRRPRRRTRGSNFRRARPPMFWLAPCLAICFGHAARTFRRALSAPIDQRYRHEFMQKVRPRSRRSSPSAVSLRRNERPSPGARPRSGGGALDRRCAPRACRLDT